MVVVTKKKLLCISNDINWFRCVILFCLRVDQIRMESNAIFIWKHFGMNSICFLLGLDILRAHKLRFGCPASVIMHTIAAHDNTHFYGILIFRWPEHKKQHKRCKKIVNGWRRIIKQPWKGNCNEHFMGKFCF